METLIMELKSLTRNRCWVGEEEVKSVVMWHGRCWVPHARWQSTVVSPPNWCFPSNVSQIEFTFRRTHGVRRPKASLSIGMKWLAPIHWGRVLYVVVVGVMVGIGSRLVRCTVRTSSNLFQNVWLWRGDGSWSKDAMLVWLFIIGIDGRFHIIILSTITTSWAGTWHCCGTGFAKLGWWSWASTRTRIDHQGSGARIGWIHVTIWWFEQCWWCRCRHRLCVVHRAPQALPTQGRLWAHHFHLVQCGGTWRSWQSSLVGGWHWANTTTVPKRCKLVCVGNQVRKEGKKWKFDN